MDKSVTEDGVMIAQMHDRLWIPVEDLFRLHKLIDEKSYQKGAADILDKIDKLIFDSKNYRVLRTQETDTHYLLPYKVKWTIQDLKKELAHTQSPETGRSRRTPGEVAHPSGDTQSQQDKRGTEPSDCLVDNLTADTNNQDMKGGVLRNG